MNPLLPPAGEEYEMPALYEVLLIPGILFLVGALFWWFTFNRDREDGKDRKLKWLAFVPFVVAIAMSYETFLRTFNDQSYREDILLNSRRLIYAGIYPAFLLPVLGILICVAWYIYDRKLSHYR